MIVKEELLDLVHSYGMTLTKYQFNHYVTKIRDYFVPFIISEYEELDISSYFLFEFTKKDIINATIFYITKNKNVKRKSAIDDFLIALNHFYVNCISKGYPNSHLITLTPFINFRSEIERELKNIGVKLLKKETYPPLNNDQYLYLKSCISKKKKHKLMSYQEPILIKLMLLYGISFDRLICLKEDSYDYRNNTLKLESLDDSRIEFSLELPCYFRKEFESLHSYKDKLKKQNLDLLFHTQTGKALTYASLHESLKKIKVEFESEFGVEFRDSTNRNPFTLTGIQKYAIINMLLGGMNEAIISDLTGQKDDILKSCQLSVSESNEIDKNRYVNHMIRGISTYDELIFESSNTTSEQRSTD